MSSCGRERRSLAVSKDSFYCFSFLINSNTEGEMNKSGHRYNVQEQQKVYAQEKERIWQAQMRSLSRKDPPQLSDDDDDRAMKHRQGSVSTPAAAESVASPAQSHASLPRAGSQQPTEKMGHRVLVLKREVRSCVLTVFMHLLTIVYRGTASLNMRLYAIKSSSLLICARKNN
jgi:hypothetical protein